MQLNMVHDPTQSAIAFRNENERQRTFDGFWSDTWPVSSKALAQAGFYYCGKEKPVFSCVLRDSTTRFVGPSVGPSIHPSIYPSVHPSVRPSVRPSVTLYFFEVFAFFSLTAPAQMME